MSIRSRLLATVAIPMLTASVLAQPALAENAAGPVLMAQESGAPAAEQPQAEPQQAEPEAAPQQQEGQPAAEEAQPKRERKRAPAQAEEQGRTAEQPAPPAAEPRQAPESEAAQPSDEQPREERKGRKNRQSEESPKPAEEQARPEAEQPKAAEPQAERPKAPEGTGEATEQAKPEKKQRRKAPAAESQEAPAKEPEATRPETRPAPPADEKPAEEAPKTDGSTTEPHHGEKRPAPQGEAQPGEAPRQPAERRPAEGEQPAGQQPTPEGQPRAEEGQQKPAPEIIDKRTPEERKALAKDPSKTDETVVLPVENGAAVLDSDKDADNSGGDRSRQERRKLRSAEKAGPPPTDDASAQTFSEKMRDDFPERIQENLRVKGTRMNEAPAFVMPDPAEMARSDRGRNGPQFRVLERDDDRVVLGEGDRIFVRGDDRPRLRRDAQEAYYDELPRGRTRETIVRPGGYRIVTVYDRYGDVVQRSRIDRDGNETLMIYAPDDEDTPRGAMMDVGEDLPPMRLTVPVDDYIVDVTDDPDRDFYDFLAQPPVERVERVYTIDEVRHSARLRDKVRRIDLDTIHFATASAEISLSQAKTLRKVADAMKQVLDRDPGETFFIEGHTDAVGSDRSNLVLSDRRAESVADTLTQVYDIPAENLVTQGYGERFLKIRTQEAEQENRRVTIRRVTPLIRPVAQR